MAQKLQNIWATNFRMKNCRRDLSKMAQSGHAAHQYLFLPAIPTNETVPDETSKGVTLGQR